MQIPPPFTFVIFGGSGDLSRRKLFPALFELYKASLLPERFHILALGRKPFNDDSLRAEFGEWIETHADEPGSDPKLLKEFMSHAHYQTMDMSQAQDYANLKERIAAVAGRDPAEVNCLFYLATPPEFFAPVSDELAKIRLNRSSSEDVWKRIIIEKPIGHDLSTARELNAALLEDFHEDQIYRIDHYLGKESVQNLLAFRFANGIFEPLWNRQFIHHVEVTSSESIGVGSRGGYYENSGALRDMVQNHLLQLLATVAMEPPREFEPDALRDEKVNVFRALEPITAESVKTHVIRGQYIESTVRGEHQAAYREETGVSADSNTETYVALKTYINNDRWRGVPFFIRTGKRLPTRVTEVVIHFNGPAQKLFKDMVTPDTGENQLVIRIQPDEGVLLKFGLKVPGAGYQVRTVGMDFHYSDINQDALPEAYERLILDALIGDNTLFARADGVEAAWEFIDPILNFWKSDESIKLYGYPAGTWGPTQSTGLFEEEDEDWRYPCKNLTGEDTYCEL